MAGFYDIFPPFGPLLGLDEEDPEPEPEPEPEPDPPPPDCACGPGAWLLELQIGGRLFRYSVGRLEVPSRKGGRVLFQSGLTDFPMKVDGLQEAQGLEIVDRRVSWSDLEARGESLDLGRATLRHLAPGEWFEDAPIVLEGPVEEPEHSNPDAPGGLVFTLQARLDDHLWPDPRARVSSDTWALATPADHATGSPTFDRTVRDAIYPTIFGYPGFDENDSSGAPTAGSPALMVYLSGGFSFPHPLGRFIVSDGIVSASTVTLYAKNQSFDLTSGTSGVDTLAVDQVVDLLGRTVSQVEIEMANANIEPQQGEPFYVGWSPTAGGGGVIRRSGPGPTRDLVDVAIWALERSGRPVDLQAQDAERDALSMFQIDGFVADELETFRWFEQVFLPMFPLVRARTNRGFYWRAVDWSPTAERAIGHLDTRDSGVRRITSIRTPVQSVRNHFQIDYGFDLRSGAYQLRRVVSAEAEGVLPWYKNPDHLSDLRAVASAVCARSQAVYGARPEPKIESRFIWSTRTATALLHARAARDAFPRRPATYTAPAAEIRRLRRGDVVLVTDPGFGPSTALALVQSIVLGSSRSTQVAVEVLDPRASTS